MKEQIRARARRLRLEAGEDPAVVDLAELRRGRLQRLRIEMSKAEVGCVVLVDPVNIRYATGARNMQIFTSRNPARYLFVPVEGPVILFEFEGCHHLADGLENITELRPAVTVSYVASAQRLQKKARDWAEEIAALARAHGGGSRRLGVERISPFAVHELVRLGFEVVDAQEPVERARAIKSTEEIAAMTHSLRVVEEGVRHMREGLRPGLTENQLWSRLHQSIIASNADYVETRLLSSGPRTNPWFQESSPRAIEDSDLVALDTDVVGPYGYYADFSRTFFCGTGRPSGRQRTLYGLALEQVYSDIELMQPGASFREIAEKAWTIPDEFAAHRYFVLAHGVGMTGEYPYILHRQDLLETGYDGVLEPNMTLCVESFIGAEGGPEGVKFEEQILVTEKGPRLMSRFPLEESFL